jgi:hypothetical protein
MEKSLGQGQYQQTIKNYRDIIVSSVSREQEVLSLIQDNPENAAFLHIELAENLLNRASYQILINSLSLAHLKIREKDAMNDSRKSIYKSIFYLEQVVSGLVDSPFSDYEERLVRIASLDAAARFFLIRKMGVAVALLEDAYGNQSQWKWAFVELEGRFAAVAKNILDLKNALSNTDIRSPGYAITVRHLRLIKKALTRAASRYREKYELSTKNLDDFMQGINFLGALRRLHILLSDKDEAETIKKKMETWTTKLEEDAKHAKLAKQEAKKN